MSSIRRTIVSSPGKTLAIGVLAAVIQHAAWADSAPVNALIEQGQYWQGRGDQQRAGEAWEKLLLIDAAHPEALYGLGILAVERKRMPQAQEYLKRLRDSGRSAVYGARLEQEIHLHTGNNMERLEQARILAESGELDKAIAQYRQLFDKRAPQGKLAFEFYNYLSYTEGGWPEAHRGLGRLLSEEPNNPMLQLTMAKLLIRNESQRTEGIRQLQRLSTRADIGGDATESWRLGLTWLGAPRPQEVPLFQAYLKAHPDDSEIRQQMQRVRASSGAAGAKASPLAGAFRALEAGRVEEAERLFQARLEKAGNDVDALGGLGLVRQKQERLGEAEQLLGRAARSAPRWKKAHEGARYWLLLEQAQEAFEQEDDSKAELLASQAIRLDGKPAEAHVLLAGLHARSGRLPQAETAYRSLIRQYPEQVDARVGLINVLAQQGKSDEALKLIEQLTPEQQAKIGDMGRLRAARAAGMARAAERRGDLQGARQLLEDALGNDPENAWIRYDLARFYLKQGAHAEARGLIDGLLLSAPDQADALYVSALLSSELGEWDNAAQALERIPQAQRTAEMQRLARDVRLQRQVRWAISQAGEGKRDQARQLLASLQAQAEGRDELLGVIASAYVDIGEPQQGLRLMREQLARTDKPKAGLLLQYAGVLLKTEQDVEAGTVLRKLQGQRLGEAEQQAFNNLSFLYRVRQAELLRQRGDLVAAFDTLEPALAERPHDSLAVATLARMYADGGEGKKALELYHAQLQRDPENASLYLGSALASAQLKDKRQADKALQNALSLAPNDADIMIGAARIYRSIGKTGQAQKLYTQALALQQAPQQVERTVAVAAAEPVVSRNPFVGLPGQRSQSTLDQVSPVATDVPYAQTASQPSAPTVSASTAVPSVSKTAAPVAAAVVAAAPVAVARSSEPAPLPAPVAVTPVEAPARIPATVAPTLVPEPAPLPRPVAAPVVASVTEPAPAVVEASPAPAVLPPAVTPVAQPATPALTPYERPRLAAQAVTQDRPEATLASTDKWQDVREELDEVRQDRSPEVIQGLTLRTNDGERGLSKLTDVQTPFELRFPIEDKRLAFRVTPVWLSSGSVSDNYYVSSRFGGGPAAALAREQGTVGSIGAQRDSGVGFSGAYEDSFNGIKADLGTTPLGFRFNTWVGSLGLEREFSRNPDLRYGVTLSRRAVTDSLLSFAGARDGRTGQEWGGVTANGGRLQLGYDNGDYGAYGYGSWHKLLGHHVESNSRFELGSGIYWHLISDDYRQLTAGLSLSGMRFDKNLSYFTYGHGGYFSPQTFVSFGLPVSWAQRSGRLSYQLKGSLGVQHIKQDGADYFPGQDALQAELAQVLATSSYGGGLRYGSSSKTGFGYSLAAAGEYQLGSHLFFGGNLGLDNAQDYQQWSGALYLRYMFENMTRPMPLPVSPYRSPYSN